MSTHNPYIAWMYQKYGTLDPVSKTIVDCFEQMADALKHQAYVLSLVINDKLNSQAEDSATLGHQTASSTRDNIELIRDKVLCQLLRCTRHAFDAAVKDPEKATFITEALEYHVLGRLVADDRIAAGPRAPQSANTEEPTENQGTSWNAGGIIAADPRLLHALTAQIEAVANDVIRQILYGEPPPLRRTEDFLPAAASSHAFATNPARSDTWDPTAGDAARANPGTCKQCGAVVESGRDNCATCEEVTSTSLRALSLVYGTMGERFLAYLADYVLIYFMVLCVYVILGVMGSPLASDESLANVLAILALVVYMTIAQVSSHTTVGKYILGLEVVNETPDRKYPSWGRVIKRETLGRICSFLFWGAGYWTAIGHPHKQAWSDRMSDTLVVSRPTNRVISRALTAFVLIALIVDLGLTAYGYQQQDKQKRYQAVSKQLASIGTDVETSRKEVERLVGIEPPDIEGYQINMRQLTPWLDRYDSEVDQMQTAIHTALNEGTISSASERQQMEKLLRLWDIRKQQSQKRREQARIIIDYVPSVRSAKQFQSELEMIDSDISSLDTQAQHLLSEVQGK